MTEMTDEKRDRILRKIKALLAKADTSKNSSVEEAQSSFVLAQRLAMEYNIDLDEAGEREKDEPMAMDVTVPKKLFWWERSLARIIASNFQVKLFYTGGLSEKISFYGFDHDVKLAKEVFISAYASIKHHCKLYVYKLDKECRTEARKSFYLGFLRGLNSKMEAEKESIEQEHGLVVVMHPKVIESYQIFSEGFGTANEINVPEVTDIDAYMEGKEKGENHDHRNKKIG